MLCAISIILGQECDFFRPIRGFAGGWRPNPKNLGFFGCWQTIGVPPEAESAKDGPAVRPRKNAGPISGAGAERF
jgi:hypothetical protein